ncbi:MAG: ATP-binding protein, partial [Gracilimonas sp.]
MGKTTQIWHKYRDIIKHNCTDELMAETSLHYWQNHLFSASVVYIIPLSLLAIIPGIYVAINTDLYGLIFVDVLAMGTILFVAFVPGITVFARKLIFNGILYLTSTTLLLYLGSFGPGLLYLFGVTIFTVLSLDRIYGYIAVGLNVFICIAIGFFIHFGWGNFEILSEYGLNTWIAVSSNLIFLSGVSALLIPILFNGLQSALLQENKLRGELEYEQAKLQKTIQQLNDKNEELEHFAYTASHDLKEPLRMVRSFMELLEKKYSDKLDDQAKKYIHFAVDGAKRMANSIDELLEYSRVGRLYVDQSEIDCEEVVQDVQNVLHSNIEELNAEIKVSPLPVIKGVPVTIKMLFQNLISNALKYQPEGQKPEIEITSSESETHWEFQIKDNGIGIDTEHHEEIFGMFRRLHTREIYQG